MRTPLQATSSSCGSFWRKIQVKHSGYKIVYDERTAEYGLACRGFSEQDVFIGWYGSFWDTFEGM